MATLVGNYNPEVFNTVLNFHDAVTSLDSFDVKDALKKVGVIFAAHGVTEEYALVLTHRHFKLEKNEILVEQLSPEGAVSQPCELKGKEVVKPLGAGEFVRPKTWSFCAEGDLAPYEFEFTAEANNNNQPPPAFVAELFQLLKSLNLETVLGLSLRSQKPGWESTNLDKKTNVVKFNNFPAESKNGKLVNVEWVFNQNGDDDENGWCYFIIIGGVKIHKHA